MTSKSDTTQAEQDTCENCGTKCGASLPYGKDCKEDDTRLEIWSAFSPQHSHMECSFSLMCEDCEYSLNETMKAVAKREIELLDRLDVEVAKISERVWSMDALALDTIVLSGNATDEQKDERNEMVTDRRAFMLLKSIIEAERSRLENE